MENIGLNIDYVKPFIDSKQIGILEPAVRKQLESIHNRSGKGSDYLGWLNLPSEISTEDLTDISNIAEELRKKIEVLVVIGIGGSYLGAKSVIEALSHGFQMLKNDQENPLILFAGQNIGEDYLVELLEILDHRSYAIVVISKSGTTTEPAIAFRVIRDHLVTKEGTSNARQRIIAVTDSRRGALRQLATSEGYRTFIIPDDVGGRYSILTPVGLIPIAISGFNISRIIEGAQQMETITGPDTPFWENPAAVYAATRNSLYGSGKIIEILVNYNPKLHYFSEWWKQLYGESEGKENKGIFPASVDLTTDLHSMGQYIQEGIRNLFETIISVTNTKNNLKIPFDETNLDRLNYLAGKQIDEVNKMAELGTILAHVDGGVPNLRIEIPEISEFYLGQLVYFFEKACAISGYLLDINPFNQPGVEAYKKNMFALLGKSGFEEETKKIREKLKK